MTASFQYDQVMLIIDQLEQCGAKIVMEIKLNKSFFKHFETVAGKPWLTKEKNMFLLFDYVHSLKCIPNNWLSEKCGTIAFKDENGDQQMAR